MYDAVQVNKIPATATMVAGYFDGALIPSTLPALRAQFPHAQVVTIAVRQGYNDADVYDVEAGDFTPASVVDEIIKGRARGKDPTVYTYISQWGACQQAFDARAVARPHWWIADWTNREHLPAGAVACQWGGPGSYDINAVAGYWPGVDPAPGELVLTKDVPIVVDGATGHGTGGTGIQRDHIVSWGIETFQDDVWVVALNETVALDGTGWLTVKAPGPFIAPQATVTVRVAYNP